LYTYNLSNACYVPCPSHSPWSDHSSYIWRGVQIMKLLIVKFSPVSRYFIPFKSKYYRQEVFSNTSSLCSSLIVGDQVLYPIGVGIPYIQM
jgi:hypothetical protein